MSFRLPEPDPPLTDAEEALAQRIVDTMIANFRGEGDPALDRKLLAMRLTAQQQSRLALRIWALQLERIAEPE
jgi:hypothetical protein